jgi:hypothetical protein
MSYPTAKWLREKHTTRTACMLILQENLVPRIIMSEAEKLLKWGHLKQIFSGFSDNINFTSKIQSYIKFSICIHP